MLKEEGIMESHYSGYKEANDRKNNVLPYYVYELYGNSGLMVPLHWHDEIEILFAKNPGKLILDGQSIPFKENDILFVNSRQLHSTYLEYGGLVYHILIDPRLYYFSHSQYMNEHYMRLPVKLPERNALFPDIINELVGIERPVKPENELYVMNLLFKMLLCMQKENYFVTNYNVDDSVQLEYIKKSIEYIENNLTEKMLIDDIADNIGISKAYLMRLFKIYTGDTIIHYLTGCRLEEARRRLMENYSVTNIAVDCGFTDAPHFCKAFKKYYGSSPINYRKMHT